MNDAIEIFTDFDLELIEMTDEELDAFATSAARSTLDFSPAAAPSSSSPVSSARDEERSDRRLPAAA